MPFDDFFWRESDGVSLANRFPREAFGIPLFRDMAGRPDLYLRLLDELAAMRMETYPTRGIICPRIFISHRRADVDQALRVAWLAHQEGFNYWLDVLDPTLAGIGGGGNARIAIALLIELALLNCSHVVAVMTTNSNGSKWMPYEYGRVKDPTPVTVQAAAWIEPGLANLGGYLYLSPMHHTENDITQWLRQQRKLWDASNPGCANALTKPWRGGNTKPLPI